MGNSTPFSFFSLLKKPFGEYGYIQHARDIASSFFHVGYVTHGTNTSVNRQTKGFNVLPEFKTAPS
jgi:hypothetical protein